MSAQTEQLPSLCVATSLRQASRKLAQLYDGVMAPSGLRSTQFAILAEVLRRDASPATVTELAEALVMDRSALSHALDPLQRQGLVVFGLDSADRRRRLVKATDEGREAYLVAEPLWASAQARFASVFGTEEAALLRTTLRGIAFDPRLAD